MTYKQIYAETNCNLHTKISWDSNYMYEIYEDTVHKAKEILGEQDSD